MLGLLGYLMTSRELEPHRIRDAYYLKYNGSDCHKISELQQAQMCVKVTTNVNHTFQPATLLLLLFFPLVSVPLFLSLSLSPPSDSLSLSLSLSDSLPLSAVSLVLCAAGWCMILPAAVSCTTP